MLALNAKDLTGQKFGKLTVIKDSGQRQRNGKRILWECQCECGNIKNILGDNLKNIAKKNQGCGCGKHKKAYNNKFIGEISGTYWQHILSHAKDRKIEVNITHEEIWNLFVKQNNKCALTGLEIYFGKRIDRNHINKSTASLDRIDGNKPYSIDNCQWVYSDLNAMKRDLSNDRFIYLCRLVTNPFKNENEKYIIHSKPKNKVAWNAKHIGDLSGGHWAQTKYGAKGRNILFEITQQEAWDLFLKQEGKCAYTGLLLNFAKDYKNPTKTASLDRINNNLGYISGNIQWVHKNINYMKRTLEEQKFIEFCQLVSKYNSEI